MTPWKNKIIEPYIKDAYKNNNNNNNNKKIKTCEQMQDR